MKKNVMTFLTILLVLVMTMGCAIPAKAEDVYTIDVVEISLPVYFISDSSMTLYQGERGALSVRELYNGNNKILIPRSVQWESSDNSVVSVYDGIITTHNAGEAVVTATYEGNTLECLVTVLAPIEIYQLQPSQANLQVGDVVVLTLSQTVSGKGTYVDNSQITWSSSNESVADIKNGIVTANSPGNATIIATYKDVSYTCEVTVIQPEQQISYELSATSVTMRAFEEYQLELYKVTNGVRSMVSAAFVDWSSSSEKIAKVSSLGKVNARQDGTTTIMATYEGKTCICTVTVDTPDDETDEIDEDDEETDDESDVDTEPVTEYQLNETSVSLKVGKQHNLILEEITDGNSKMISGLRSTWKSSNPKVVTVAGGRLNAKKAGTAVITARYQGQVFKCHVRVTGKKKTKTVNWKKLYKNYIQGNEWCRTQAESARLIYVNNDRIPEIYIEGKSMASDYKLLSIYKGKVCETTGNRNMLTYAPKKGIVYEEFGHMDEMVFNWGKLKKGKVVFTVQDTYGVIINKDGSFTYTLNNKHISEKAYEKKANKIKGNYKYESGYVEGKMLSMKDLLKKL